MILPDSCPKCGSKLDYSNSELTIHKKIGQDWIRSVERILSCTNIQLNPTIERLASDEYCEWKQIFVIEEPIVENYEAPKMEEKDSKVERSVKECFECNRMFLTDFEFESICKDCKF